MEKSNNSNLLLIDYEYGGWNPMAMDLANYINETMLDNGYPEKNGIAWYLDNCMTKPEVKEMSKVYLIRYFDKYISEELKNKYSDSNTFVNAVIDEFMGQVWNCCILNNLFWGVWALSLLKPEDCTEPGIFNYDFAMSRVEMNQKI